MSFEWHAATDIPNLKIALASGSKRQGPFLVNTSTTRAIHLCLFPGFPGLTDVIVHFNSQMYKEICVLISSLFVS